MSSKKDPGKIYLIEPEARDFMNRAILEELAAEGLDPRFYPSEQAMIDAGDDLTEAEVLITNACSRALMDRGPNLRAVINPYTGSEHIDRAAALDRGLLIGNGATQENYIGMAEATILLLLQCFYTLPLCEEVLRESQPRPLVSARMLAGKTVGIIGYGKIAQAVGRRLAPWDLRLLVSAPRLHAAVPAEATHVSLEELLARSDAVLLLCSLNPETRNLLSRERLETLKPGAVLVNTSRGGLVDEAALVDLLKSGRIAKVALDAFELEPLPRDHPLRAAPNAILTPHMIGHTIEAQDSMWRNACEGVRSVLAGRPPAHVFNPEVLERWTARQDARQT